MKEAVVSVENDVVSSKIQEVAVPKPGPTQVLIKVVVAGSNPKDWKYPMISKNAFNSGDDVAGIVESAGERAAKSFKKGDKVGTFHVMLAPNGSFGEYAIGEAHTTFHVPDEVSFEEAATFPLAYATAALLWQRQPELPTPWMKQYKSETPLLVWSAGSAVGCFAIKLAKLANIRPVIAVCNHHEYVSTLLDKSTDAVFTYEQAEKGEIAKFLNGRKLEHAFDTMSEKGSTPATAKVMNATNPSKTPQISTLLPVKGDDVPDNADVRTIWVGSVHAGEQKSFKPSVDQDYSGDMEFGQLIFALLGYWLDTKKIAAHPHEVVGGLDAVAQGLQRVKDGKHLGKKMVFRLSGPSRENSKL